MKVDKKFINRQIVPYDTGKVKIGLLYEPPKQRMTRDEEIIQAALMKWSVGPEIPWRRIAEVIVILMVFATSIRWWKT